MLSALTVPPEPSFTINSGPVIPSNQGKFSTSPKVVMSCPPGTPYLVLSSNISGFKFARPPDHTAITYPTGPDQWRAFFNGVFQQHFPSR
jgi:hypothetical protein